MEVNPLIKIFMVTYNNASHLNESLTSLYETDIAKYNTQISILNNHSNFQISEKFKDINVIHNAARPDFSTGHLSRSWNQAIIHGFENLVKPKCDILITVQDDVIFAKDFFSKLLVMHERYSFISFGYGDAMCSYLPDAIKKIGLWDERFCNIGYQEADYFFRALMYNKEKSSINDRRHGREINKEEALVFNPDKNAEKNAAHNLSKSFHNISLALFNHKYGGVDPEWWAQSLIENPPMGFKCVNYIYYPYFEKDIELEGKNYFNHKG